MKIVEIRVREGKSDFYHHFAFLTNFLKMCTFLLGGMGSFSARPEDKCV